MTAHEENTVTPKDLANELGVDQRAIRVFLRKKYGLLPPFVSRWKLEPSRAEGVRERFRSPGSQ